MPVARSSAKPQRRRRLRPLRTRSQFAAHVALFLFLAAAFLLVLLGLGVLGYHYVADLPWIDALLNAAMILPGEGPVDPMPSDAAKLFSSFYALLSGAVYPAMTAVVLYPFVHRMLHALHLEAMEHDSDDYV